MSIELNGKLLIGACLAIVSNGVLANDDKLTEDPTKVVTQLGASYSDEVKVSGSLSLDPIRKLNASISLESEEWRFGGSWLFDIGIVNFNFGKQAFDHGAEKTSYSVGTFIPLSYFDIEPMGWQIFAMGGYSHTEGDIACETESNNCPIIEMPSTDGWVLVPNATNGGYLGAFALKPLAGNWTLITAAAYSMGSDDYSGYFAALGASYQIDKRQKLKVFGATQNSDYGSDTNLGVGYTYQFN
ncbi:MULTISPECIES: hypothetical protein [Pseudoalteromonas]|uniref:hypothetical protein n=1 Tax=Pseudoalteromonas TaxID=53246 RepID=UPI00030DFC21|nr:MULTISPECIES: hypothetical protein [Pseudoalteromonas]MCF6144681.1 hypothetical protein [Pseudoalteromonas mariniglutinosa NCIMB 1770]